MEAKGQDPNKKIYRIKKVLHKKSSKRDNIRKVKIDKLTRTLKQ